MKQPYIIVDRQQASVIRNARRSVQVRDPEGRLIAFIEPAPTEEEIARAMARRNLDEPEYSTAEVRAHLRSLDCKM
jgi:hypothetical protein